MIKSILNNSNFELGTSHGCNNMGFLIFSTINTRHCKQRSTKFSHISLHTWLIIMVSNSHVCLFGNLDGLLSEHHETPSMTFTHPLVRASHLHQTLNQNSGRVCNNYSNLLESSSILLQTPPNPSDSRMHHMLWNQG